MGGRTKLPARFPPFGAWPAVLRADMAAAFLDYPDTSALAAAVAKGDAPAPTAMRKAGDKREPVWARGAIEQFIASRHGVANDNGPAPSTLRDLV